MGKIRGLTEVVLFAIIGIELAQEEFESERDRLQDLGFEVRFSEHPFLPLKGITSAIRMATR